ncbi:MAG: cadherin repeat domain-containing protein [Planctomycetaceae bacterium]
MTPRERILAIGVGSVLVLAGGQYMFSKYRNAVNVRTTRIASLNDQLFSANDKCLQGALAERQMGDYLVRSLPSDPERARADYTRWLFDTIALLELRDASVSFVNSMPVGDLYDRYGFKVSGKTDARGWVELMHAFYSKDYLHRISEMTIRPAREGGLAIDLTIDAISLRAAPPDAPAPGDNSPLVGKFQTYADAILNRNYFSGPNLPPKFSSPDRLATDVGKPASISISAEDAEQGSLSYEILGEAPEGLELDPETGAVRWEPKQTGEYTLTVKVTDNGYPRQSVEKQFEIAVVDPPPPPAPPAAEPTFDDSTQTVLTALVQGRGDWTAWMKVRTRGTTLKLRPGDEFEIGTLSGKVVEVTSKFAVLEIDGKRFELRPAGVLSEAAKNAAKPDA